jgi:predicted nuclease of restriction endonuclease-like (RecB) superfamily
MGRKSNREETQKEQKTGNEVVPDDALTVVHIREYSSLVVDITKLLEQSRRVSARSVNAIMTATYWEIGHCIVEFEQKGEKRAEYGKAVMERLSLDLSSKFGRGFSRQNLQQMRQFYLSFPSERICQTPSGKFTLAQMSSCFPLPWSAYVRLLAVKNEHARKFYETEALQGGWSVRQLDRQINSQFYERTVLSKDKASILAKGSQAQLDDKLTPEEEIKDPYVLEFLGLKDEYSENDLEEALIQHLETFLLELGGDFCFIGRQKRLRIGDDWYRVDLVFFQRRLRCLILIDLKLGKFTHADAGQMHVYLNYAREHWMQPQENPPVGLILCAQKDSALARYALEGLPNKVMAAEYKTVLPDEKLIAWELERTRKILESRKSRNTSE